MLIFSLPDFETEFSFVLWIMNKTSSLKKPHDFIALRSTGKDWSDRFLVLIARPNGLNTTRIGFSVGKRLGGAVIRNRIKRRLRALCSEINILEGWDILLIARTGSQCLDFHTFRKSLNYLFRKAKLNKISPDSMKDSAYV